MRKGQNHSEETLMKMSAALIGRKRPEETRKKMSAARSGKKHSDESRKKISAAQTGKKHSEETRMKMSAAQSGENNPNWKGGISCEPYCQQWQDKEYKESIKIRDGHRCLNPECSGISSRLAIHHINYDKKDCHPKNLITICTSCNAKANKNRNWHKSWYSAIIQKRGN